MLYTAWNNSFCTGLKFNICAGLHAHLLTSLMCTLQISYIGERGGADCILCNVHRHSGDAMDRLAVTEALGRKQQCDLIRKGDGKQH